MDILKFVESLPDNVKNVIISALINSSVAMKNVEQEIITVDSPETVNPVQQGYRKSRVNLLESMKAGHYNAEYVNYFYEVLRRADELVNNSTPEELKMLAEKYGMGKAAGARYDLLSENHRQVHGNRNPQQVKRDEYSRRATSDDNAPIEKMVTNKKHLQNVLDHSIGAKPIYKYSLRVQRMFQTRMNIEQICDYLHVRELLSERNGRILEFYIPKNYGVKNLMYTNRQLFDEFKNITGVSFNDDYGQPSDYRIHSFYKMSENGMYDVIKFKGIKIENIGFMRH